MLSEPLPVVIPLEKRAHQGGPSVPYSRPHRPAQTAVESSWTQPDAPRWVSEGTVTIASAGSPSRGPGRDRRLVSHAYGRAAAAVPRQQLGVDARACPLCFAHVQSRLEFARVYLSACACDYRWAVRAFMRTPQRTPHTVR